MPNTISVTSPDFLNAEIYGHFSRLKDEDLTTLSDVNNLRLEPRLKGSLLRLNKMVEQLRYKIRKESVIKIVRDNNAISYCAENYLIKHLAIAEELIRKHFSNIENMHLSLNHDPETSDQWLEVEIQIPGDIDEVLEREDNYVREWVDAVPFPQSTQIRLSCDILS